MDTGAQLALALEQLEAHLLALRLVAGDVEEAGRAKVGHDLLIHALQQGVEVGGGGEDLPHLEQRGHLLGAGVGVAQQGVVLHRDCRLVGEDRQGLHGARCGAVPILRVAHEHHPKQLALGGVQRHAEPVARLPLLGAARIVEGDVVEDSRGEANL